MKFLHPDFFLLDAKANTLLSAVFLFRPLELVAETVELKQQWLEALTELKVLADDVGCDILVFQRETDNLNAVSVCVHTAFGTAQTKEAPSVCQGRCVRA